MRRVRHIISIDGRGVFREKRLKWRIYLDTGWNFKMGDTDTHGPNVGWARAFMPGMVLPEKTVLKQAEKRGGLSWDRLHAYKTVMSFPLLPENMPASVVLDQNDIPLCENVYKGLDRCLDQGSMNELSDSPFARLVICKAKWLNFERCVRRRDHKMIKKIFEWERNNFAYLDMKHQDEYLVDMTNKMRYIDYSMQQEPDQGEKQKLERDFMHLRLRKENLQTNLSLDEVKKVWNKTSRYIFPHGQFSK